MDSLDRVTEEVVGCTICMLSRSRKLAVPGEGPARAPLMFVGEAPGFHENEQGRPFVGAAGQLLEELLAMIGLERSDVYITNVVKCRPPGNRDPEPQEVEACRPYLERQIELISPRIIVTLGRHSMATLMGKAEPISRAHGRPRRVRGRLIYPMYHPAAALRQPSLRKVLEEDMLRLPTLLQGLEGAPQQDEEDEDSGEQLSLFPGRA